MKPSPLQQRVVTAAVLIAAFLPALFLLPQTAWNLLCMGVVGLCSREWARLCGLTTAWTVSFTILTVAVAALLMLDTFHSPWPYIASSAIWLTAVPVLLWKRPQVIGANIRLAVGALFVIAAALSLSSLRMMNPMLLLVLMGIVWISDSAAFFAGRTWGKHKLAPMISPGKTWEGVLGGMLAVFCYALVIRYLMPTLPLPAWIPANLGIALIWLFLAAAGILGDLAESWAKRMAGVKDSGNILPGHGGMLDRVDGLLPVLPIAALFYSL